MILSLNEITKMSSQDLNIHTTFNQMLTRSDKEKFLNQKACVIWMTGLSGAGKTTIAQHIERELNRRGHLTQILDGDNIRSGINCNLGFSQDDRIENIRRISEISKLFINCGIICINSFISPTRKIRHMAMDIIGKEDFIEVFLNAPLSVCEKRDVKGLYKLARAGKIKEFTGIDAPYENPQEPHLEVKTDELTIKDSVKKCLEYILPKVTR